MQGGYSKYSKSYKRETEKIGKEIVKNNIGNIFTQSQGAVIFEGSKYGKIIDIQPAIDGVRFSQSNVQKPRLIIYHSKNDGDLVCEIISQCLSNYEG